MEPSTAGFLLAIGSATIFALMNVLDKHVVSQRVKNPLAYTFITGMVNLLFGLIIAISTSWNGISWSDLIIPFIAGAVFGSQFITYYLILQKEDVSQIIGFVYIYPILVALLSTLVLGEILSMTAYIGIFFILTGAFVMSVRLKKIKMEIGLWMVGVMIITVALYEFLIKLSTSHLNVWQGTAINGVAIGIILMTLLLHTKTRRAIFGEATATPWALGTEILTVSAVWMLYAAMTILPATIVSSISAIQPLAVLIIERIAHKMGFTTLKDDALLPRAGAIILIVIGVALLYFNPV